MSIDTVTTTSDQGQRSANGFGAALRYEWTSLRTLRSTWVLSGLGVALQLVLALVQGSRESSSGFDEFTSGISLVTLVTAVLVAAIGVNAFGAGTRHRTIEVTTLTLRSPSRILLAKSVVIAGIAVVTGLLAVLVNWLGVLVIAGKVPDPASASAATLGTIVYVVLSGLIGLALAALTRQAVLALGAILVWSGGLEAAIGGLCRLPDEAMPFTAAKEAASTSGSELYLALPLVGVTVVLLVGAFAVLSRRDT